MKTQQSQKIIKLKKKFLSVPGAMFPLKALKEYLFCSFSLFLLLATIPNSPLACRYTTPASACLHTHLPFVSVSSPYDQEPT